MLPPPPERRDRAIVLVHGAWVGEWSWTPVLPLLEATGRAVHAVSLTGQGARRHEARPDITVDEHVDDVVGVIETFDLRDITLVGHSYGGRVISRVFVRAADRIARLVYLDAHAPTAPDTGQSPERLAIAERHGGFLPFAGYDPDASEVGGAEGVAWFLDRVTPHPLSTLVEPMPGPLPDHVDKTFVHATGYGPSRFDGYAAGAAANGTWDVIELPGSHWLMFSHPDEVAAIIAR